MHNIRETLIYRAVPQTPLLFFFDKWKGALLTLLRLKMHELRASQKHFPKERRRRRFLRYE